MSVRRSLVWSFALKAASFVIYFVTSVLIARLLTPTEVGVYSVAAGVFAILQMQRDFGTSTYLVQEKQLHGGVVAAAFGLTLASSFTIGALFYGASDWIAAQFDDPEVGSVCRILALSFLLSPLSIPLLALLRRDLKIDILFRLNIAAVLAASVVSVGLAALGVGPTSLAWGQVAQAAALVVLGYAVAHDYPWVRPSVRGWGPLLRFGSGMSLLGAVSQAGLSLPELIVGRLIGLEAAGLMSRAAGTTRMVHAGMREAVSFVALPALAAHHRAGRSFAEPYARKTEFFALISWPLFGILGLLAEPIVLLLFGPNWTGAIPLIQILAVGGVFFPMGAISSDFLIAAGRVGLEVKVRALVTVVRIGLIVPAAFISLSMVAWALVAARLANALIYQATMVSQFDATWRELWRPAATASVPSIAALCGPAAIAYWGFGAQDPVIAVGAGLLTAGIGWLTAIWLFRPALWGEVRGMIDAARREVAARKRPT